MERIISLSNQTIPQGLEIKALILHLTQSRQLVEVPVVKLMVRVYQLTIEMAVQVVVQV